MAVILRASNPAGALGLSSSFLPRGREESSCISKPAPGRWGLVYSGRGHTLQDSTAYFKADIRILLKAPSACPPDP